MWDSSGAELDVWVECNVPYLHPSSLAKVYAASTAAVIEVSEYGDGRSAHPDAASSGAARDEGSGGGAPAPVSVGGADSVAQNEEGGQAGGQAAPPREGEGVTRNGPYTVKHLMTHVPKRDDCLACQAAKMKRRPCRRLPEGSTADKHEGFGELITMDHIDAHGDNQSRLAHVGALSVLDVGTSFGYAFPVKFKDADETLECLQRFIGSTPIRAFYCDGAPALTSAAKQLKAPVDTSKAARPQTNGVIERFNQEVCRGTKVALMQAGLPPPFWDLAMEHFCHSRNVVVVDGTSPWFERNGVHFPGQLIPFGSLVDYMPPETSGVGREVKQRKFGPSTAKGVFLGYALDTGMK